MADEPKEVPSKRVAVITEDGKFGTIDEKFADEIRNSGGRVLTRQQVAERAEQERYDKLSTGEKILGGVNTALGTVAGPIGWAAGGVAAPAQALRGYSGGVQSGLTAGLGDAAGRYVSEAIGGKPAGQKYAEAVDESAEASPVARMAGQGVGLVGSAALGSGAGAAAKAIPGAAIGALGDLAEGGVQAAGRALGYEGATVAGRAAMSAAELGGRGLVEGALYGGAEAAGDAVLHDVDNASDKVFSAIGTGALYGAAGSAALGAGGSLLKSGAGAALSGLSRVMKPAEIAEHGVEAVAGKEAGKVQQIAYDRAWRSTGGRKAFAAEANKYLPNGTNDVGEALLRHGVIDHAGGVVGAARNGTAEAIAERVAEPIGTVGAKLGELIDSSGGQVPLASLGKAFDDVIAPLQKKAGYEGVENGVRNYAYSLFNKLGLTAESASVSVKDLMFQRQSLDSLIYKEAKSLDPGGRVEALREVRGGIERAIEDAIDSASGKLPGELKAEYKSLKHDYQALRIAQKAADDAVTRGAANRTFSLTDKIIGAAAGTAGSAIGGPIGGLIAGPGAAAVSKVVRERADAAAAAALYRASTRGSLVGMVENTNALIDKASKGLLAAPAKGALPPAASMPASKSLAKLAMTRVAEFQANPDAFIDKASRQAESLAVHSPEIAQALVGKQVQAMTFLASKVPVTPDPDPLDPHPAPKMTANEEAELGRYMWYVEKPERFFHEVAHGKMTFEGAETAQHLMPGAFADLQQQTTEHLATMMAKGQKLPFNQRQYIGILMDIAATPAQRPDHMAFLQKNLEPLPDQNPPPMPKGGGAALAGATKVSSYDRLESGGLGR